MTSVPKLLLLAVIAVAVHSRPSENKWKVPCDGYYQAMEVVCGGEGRSAPTRVRRDANVTTSDGISHRVKRSDSDFECSFDYPICSAGLQQKLCSGTCEDKYYFAGNTLKVSTPCLGVFTVVLCKP